MLKWIHRVFGHVQWQAPEWIRWTGLRFRHAGRYLMADRKRLLVAALAVVVAAGALTWYKVRPKPHYVEYAVTAPKLTEYDENGISSIYPLMVDFKEPAAPLASLDKRLTAGIQISPAFAGKWTWLDDKRLRPVLEKLLTACKVRALGISINRWEPWNGVRAVQSGLIDSVQVMYNIFDQNPEGQLFPACAALDVGVIARCPLDQGSLTGVLTLESKWPEGDWRQWHGGSNRVATSRVAGRGASVGFIVMRCIAFTG